MALSKDIQASDHSSHTCARIIQVDLKVACIPVTTRKAVSCGGAPWPGYLRNRVPS